MMHDVEWRVRIGKWSTLEEQRIAALGVLCELLDDNVLVEHNSVGVPFLPNYPDLYISISHCRMAVAVAVGRCEPVGIDVECRRHVNRMLSQRVCTEDEERVIEASQDSDMCFLQLWTRKEAVLKCKHTGIQGFDSLANALYDERFVVKNIDCQSVDVVGAIAVPVTSLL